MLFANPHWLWLLLLAPAIAAVEWRSNGPRRAWTTLLRSACLATLVLALSRPIIARQHVAATNVVVIELGPTVSSAGLSASLATLKSMPAGSTRVVAFADRAEVVSDWSVFENAEALAALRQRLGRRAWGDELQNSATSLADALRLAGTQIPADGRGSVRLLSTGQSDHGDAAAEAWRLAQRGIAVVAEPADLSPASALLVKNVVVPPSARVGQSVRADVTVESSIATKATLHLKAGNADPVTKTADLVSGLNRVTVDFPIRQSGLTTVAVSVYASAGSPPAAAVRAALSVNTITRVLVVQGKLDANLVQVMAAILGPSASVTAVTPDELATQSPAELDAVVLADLPADQLPVAAQAVLRDAVAGGTGLLVVGAARSFGPGGYDDSQLASLLPVKMPQQMESIDPSTTLVLIIDTSGSMKGDRIDLTKEVSRLALSHLKPHDKAGIVEFFGGKRWAAPIQSAGNLSVIHRALDRLTAGGSTTLFPAVEEAAFALRNVRTRSKHVLICSDGFVENAPFAVLVRQMADDGIMVSTAQIAAAEGAANMMPDIARWGNGRFYTVPDQYALPDLSFKQPQMSLTSSVVRTASVLSVGTDPLTRDLKAGDLGEVQGYVRTQAKPTADVLLKTAGGDPLLVRWRYGAGFVAALPTQLGSTMTASLQDRPAFAKLLADLLRQIGSSRGLPLRIAATVRPAGLEVAVTAVDTTSTSVDGTVTLTASDPAGKAVRETTAEAIGPGHWNVLLPDMTAGAYLLTATVRGTTLTGQAGAAIAPPQPALSIDRDLLQRINEFGPLAAERAAQLPPGHSAFFEVQKWLAAAAAILLLAHVAVRRWPAGLRTLRTQTS